MYCIMHYKQFVLIYCKIENKTLYTNNIMFFKKNGKSLFFT